MIGLAVPSPPREAPPEPSSEAATPAANPATRLRTRRWRFAKRAVETTIAVVLLLGLAPLLLALSAAVLLCSGQPVFFQQYRVGRGGKVFLILKFRTMVVGAPSWLDGDALLSDRHRQGGFKLCPHEDPRITPVGRWLRRTSLDELPQLLNVLAGSMALVGPRPVVPAELPVLFGEDAGGYEEVRPGMTGPWQVSRDAVASPSRRQLDAEYSARWSLARDLAILLRTPVAVLRAARADR